MAFEELALIYRPKGHQIMDFPWMCSFLHVARIEISFMGKLCRVHYFASWCLSILSSFSDSSYYSPDTSLWERFQQIFCLFWTDLLWGEDCIDLFVADNVNLLLDVRKCNLSWWLLEITVVPFCLSIIKRFTTSWYFIMSPKSKEKKAEVHEKKEVNISRGSSVVLILIHTQDHARCWNLM